MLQPWITQDDQVSIVFNRQQHCDAAIHGLQFAEEVQAGLEAAQVLVRQGSKRHQDVIVWVHALLGEELDFLFAFVDNIFNTSVI